MKRRILSLLLCLVLVVGMLPSEHTHVHASDDYEDGSECYFCGNYIWGDWVCDCGDGNIHCGENSGYSDCYEEHHCSDCGKYIEFEEDVCSDCGMCYDCAHTGITSVTFCTDCNRCLYCVPEVGFGFCEVCGRCIDCVGDSHFCELCDRCYDCGGGMCSEGEDHPCRLCHDGYTCPDCDQCLLLDGENVVEWCYNCYRCENCVEKCSGWGEGHYYCLEEHDDYDYCPDCKHCYAVDIINAVEGKTYGCEDCNKCANCVAAVCKDCGRCSDCVEICERCGNYCLDCHDSHGSVCPSCGMCYRGVSHCPDCGYCEECSDLCKRCGSCRTCEYSHHCNICGACDQSGIYLCEECLRCPDCTLFCDKCGECVICHPDNHCTDCKEHYDDDELCPDCGRCASCIGGYELCEHCGYCFDCAEDWHCSECQGCKNDGKEICESCRMCLDCADTANQHCGSLSCNNCYEDYLYCEICDECVDCIGEDNYCFDCYQCKEHHGDDGCDGEGSHTHKVKDEWQYDAKNHWQECRQCKEPVNTAIHTFNLNKKCTVCGYDATELIQFTSQPRDRRAKVSDTDADADDPLCPNNNTVTFSVVAKAVDKGTLSYQWYYKFGADGATEYKITDADKTANRSGKTTGAQTAKLTLPVSWEACVQDFVYFCRVTLTSSDGKVLYTADSDMAALKGIHVYNRCKPVYTDGSYKLYYEGSSGSVGYFWVSNDDGTHRYYCCGEGDEERFDPRGKAEPHNYGTAETITASKVDPESSSFTGYKEFYKYKCKDCGAVSYVEKHAHHYEVPLDYSDEEATAFLTANVTDELHPLRCTVEGCSSVIYEKHDYRAKVYARHDTTWSYDETVGDDVATITPGQYVLECYECEYVLSGRGLNEANGGKSWTPELTLVTATGAGVEAKGTSDSTLCLAAAGDTIVLTPQNRDGKKITGWTAKYTDSYMKYSGGEHDGEYVTAEPEFTYQKNDDGSWQFTMPTEKEWKTWAVNIGGLLHLTPIYAECKHENGTKLVNKKDAVCIYEGYTGDEVCVDCGEIIGKIGDYIPAPSDEHEGEWVLIESTKTEANCKHGGYTGDYQCSECGDIQLGKKVPVKHGEKERRNAKEATCVSTGSTGDIYCKDCGKKLMSGRTIPIDPDNHVNTTTSHIREPKCTVKGYISARKCKDCGEVLIAAKQFPALGHLWDEGTVTKEPTTTETGEKTLHCTRDGCSKTKVESIPTLASTAMETVAVTVKAPVLGETATKATNTADTYTIANTSWADYDGYDLAIGDAFKGGRKYTVRVELEATGTNVFAESTKYTINGAEARVVSWYMDHAILTYTFPATDRGAQTITADDVTATYGDTDKSISAATSGDGALSYAVTGGEDVVEVDATTGALTFKKAGTATVTVTAAETATYTQATKDVTVNVAKKEIEIAGSSPIARPYKKGDFSVSIGGVGFSGTVGSELLVKDTDYTVTATVPNDNVGTYDYTINVTLKGDADSKYQLKTNSATHHGANIYKADPTAPTGLNGRTGNKLSTVILPEGWTWVNGDTVMAEGTQTYQANYEGTVNYNPATNVDLTVIVSDKDVQTIEASNVTATYGETGKSINATLTTGSGALSYAVTSGDAVEVDATTGALTFKKAGIATVTVTAAETETYAKAIRNVTVLVNKATVTITAADKSAYLYDSAPDLSSPVLGVDYTVTGLIGTDTLDSAVVLTCAADMNKAGNYAIVPSVTGKDARYDFAFVNGTLTVSKLPSTGGSHISTYAITVEDAKNGAVTADRKSASSGTTVTVMATPDKGYALETLTVLDKNGKEVKLTDKGSGKYTFIMPTSRVTVKATFAEDSTGGFVDVPKDSYYYDAVEWAVDKGITTGTPDGLFDPDGVCTRAQAVTFLWRAAGCPAPKSTVTPFTDLVSGSYYETAVLWAVENGITRGTEDGTTFSPELACDRAQIVTLLHRFAQLLGKDVSVGKDTNILSYADATSIPDYAFAAMQWACGAGVMQGDGVNLMPAMVCTRAQIVTFLYRCMK